MIDTIRALEKQIEECRNIMRQTVREKLNERKWSIRELARRAKLDPGNLAAGLRGEERSKAILEKAYTYMTNH